MRIISLGAGLLIGLGGCAVDSNEVELAEVGGAIVASGPLVQPCDGSFRVETQAQWGKPANQKNEAASLLAANFSAALPEGLTIGCSMHSVSFSGPSAIAAALPSKGAPAPLSQSQVDPVALNNALAGEVAALALSVAFDETLPSFGPGAHPLSYMEVATGEFSGWKVGELLATANDVLGGCSNDYSPSKMRAVIRQVNRGTALSSTVRIDFDTDAQGVSLPSGLIPQGEWPGVHFSCDATKASHSDACVLFDTAAPTGGDADLGTPNAAYGGPGVGPGGAVAGPGKNHLSRGLVLVAAENVVDQNQDGLVDVPDDAGAGAVIQLNFDEPVKVKTLELLDISQPTSIVCIKHGGGSKTVVAPALGENSYQKVKVGCANAVEIQVHLQNSGGLAAVNYAPWVSSLACQPPVETPCDPLWVQCDNQPGLEQPKDLIAWKEEAGQWVSTVVTCAGTPHEYVSFPAGYDHVSCPIYREARYYWGNGPSFKKDCDPGSIVRLDEAGASAALVCPGEGMVEFEAFSFFNGFTRWALSCSPGAVVDTTQYFGQRVTFDDPLTDLTATSQVACPLAGRVDVSYFEATVPTSAYDGRWYRLDCTPGALMSLSGVNL